MNASISNQMTSTAHTPSNGHRLQKLSTALLSVAALSCASALTLADTVGFRAGAYLWQPSYEGTVKSGTESVDVKKDLGLSDDDANVYFIAIEHPIPVLPNILLQHSSIKTNATNRLTRTFTFDNVIYTASDSVKTDLDLSHTDATLYYELLDNWVNLDLGLTIRHFDQGVKIQSATFGTSSKADINATIPMIYLAARFDLPLSGLYVGLDGNGIGYSGNTLFDYRAMIGYESKIGLGAEVGVRNFDLTYENGSDKADVTVDGAYAQIFYHF